MPIPVPVLLHLKTFGLPFDGIALNYLWASEGEPFAALGSVRELMLCVDNSAAIGRPSPSSAEALDRSLLFSR